MGPAAAAGLAKAAAAVAAAEGGKSVPGVGPACRPEALVGLVLALTSQPSVLPRAARADVASLVEALSGAKHVDHAGVLLAVFDAAGRAASVNAAELTALADVAATAVARGGPSVSDAWIDSHKNHLRASSRLLSALATRGVGGKMGGSAGGGGLPPSLISRLRAAHAKSLGTATTASKVRRPGDGRASAPLCRGRSNYRHLSHSPTPPPRHAQHAARADAACAALLRGGDGGGSGLEVGTAAAMGTAAALRTGSERRAAARRSVAAATVSSSSGGGGVQMAALVLAPLVAAVVGGVGMMIFDPTGALALARRVVGAEEADALAMRLDAAVRSVGGGLGTSN